MKQIAKTDFYELRYDESQNWIYWTMQGFWKSMDVAAPNFDKDWDSAIAEVQPGWKLFADLSKLKAMPDDVKAAQDAKQQVLMQKGCTKVSCIMESAVTKMSLNEVIEKSGMKKMIQYFDDAKEANEWLKA